MPHSGFLSALRALCDEFGVLLIVDDVQTGCGRTGTFFSFEKEGVVPDLVPLSKSIAAGFPMAILLVRPDLDVFTPGEHNGTFRGFQLAYVAATAALSYYEDDALLNRVNALSALVDTFFEKEIAPLGNVKHRGVGLLHGLDLSALGDGFADRVREYAFCHRLIVETCGRRSSVIKILPPLTVTEEELLSGLRVLRDGIKSLL